MNSRNKNSIDLGALIQAENLKRLEFDKLFPTISLNDIVVTEDYKKIKRYIENNTPIIIVSGKAGTGKSTLISFIEYSIKRDIVIVAPTGVAALNVKGVTIHSYFHLPHRLIMEEDIIAIKDRSLYTNIDLLIVDEISMVRVDVMDAMDKFLRLNGKDENMPFGGAQLLLIGDFFQLPPVVKHQEKEILESFGYDSPYFFSANCLKNNEVVHIELNKIFRQKDRKFISILNQIRLAENLNNVLPIINSRYKMEEDFKGNFAVTLTCTNSVADQINNNELQQLTGDSITYMGKVSGQFGLDDHRLPSPLYLELKVGAQIMFTKNGKFWVNGTVGKVVSLRAKGIQVLISLSNTQKIVDVEIAKWESFSYEFDPVDKKIKPVVSGTFEQYPLMLAWAITIHKSQGKTLEKIRIDVGRGAFATGQIYVALSRTRMLKDISLLKKIGVSDIRCDERIKRFYQKISEKEFSLNINTPTANESKPLDNRCPQCNCKLVHRYKFKRIFIECPKCKYKRD